MVTSRLGPFILEVSLNHPPGARTGASEAPLFRLQVRALAQPVLDEGALIQLEGCFVE